jgi:hypothetical protein
MTKTNDKKPTPKRAPYGKERKLSEHEENIVRPLDDHEKSEARVAKTRRTMRRSASRASCRASSPTSTSSASC